MKARAGAVLAVLGAGGERQRITVPSRALKLAREPRGAIGWWRVWCTQQRRSGSQSCGGPTGKLCSSRLASGRRWTGGMAVTGRGGTWASEFACCVGRAQVRWAGPEGWRGSRCTRRRLHEHHSSRGHREGLVGALMEGTADNGARTSIRAHASAATALLGRRGADSKEQRPYEHCDSCRCGGDVIRCLRGDAAKIDTRASIEARAGILARSLGGAGARRRITEPARPRAAVSGPGEARRR